MPHHTILSYPHDNTIPHPAVHHTTPYRTQYTTPHHIVHHTTPWTHYTVPHHTTHATPYRVSEWVISQFNGTSTPKGSYRAKTGDNDCNVNSSRYTLRTALCESNSLPGQVWTKMSDKNLIPRVRYTIQNHLHHTIQYNTIHNTPHHTTPHNRVLHHTTLCTYSNLPLSLHTA